MKNHRKSKRALSPVVASIILIAVTVAVSIAVAAWMGALVVGQMQTEEIKITNIQFYASGSPSVQYINLTISNTAATTSTLDQALVDSTPKIFDLYTKADPTTPVTSNTVAANAQGSTIRITASWTSGNTYAFKLVTTKGNYYTYTAVAP